ncbi:MAG: UDP-galactose 4-epimerase [Verrucomicrobiales bacterium]|nr:UDP-galactose 4-epimerase [Verrucomicrobiales bacterium]
MTWEITGDSERIFHHSPNQSCTIRQNNSALIGETHGPQEFIQRENNRAALSRTLPQMSFSRSRNERQCAHNKIEMSKRILITGGAGFIGSHVADELLESGYTVRVFDSLAPQVHGPERNRPTYLNSEVELLLGDVRDERALSKALEGVDAVYHFAAMVGVGQSMYEIAQYTSVNNSGTAVLLQQLIKKPVERLVVASSMSVYGEGLYQTDEGEIVDGSERGLEQLRKHAWELTSREGKDLQPIATPETKTPSLASVYALSKYDQERMSLLIGRAYKMPTVALRFFNVYGPHQALSNPYTGVLAIFASQLLNNNAPSIFEDGLQRRDFVSVHDVAHACTLALEVPEAADEVFNIGSGENFTVREVARRMGAAVNKQIEPEITGKYRVGDIRHCFSDITKARKILGYEPIVSFDEGLEELVNWLEGEVAVDKVTQAKAELAARGL